MSGIFYIGRMPRDAARQNWTVARYNQHAQRHEALAPRHDLVRAARGFQWGHCGTAPAQLAVAILADALGDDTRALNLFGGFLAKVIQRLPRESWAIQADHVRRWADDPSSPVLVWLVGRATVEIDLSALVDKVAREIVDTYLENTAYERN